jgi:hypothetical protein
MDLTSLHRLLTAEGQQALQAASALKPREADFLALFTELSRRFPPDLAKSALEIAILREEADIKFPFAERMYFTREALEQASPYEVSRYRSRRFQGFDRLVDLGCSVGGDTISLAAQAPTIGIDLDPLRLAMAGANLAALGLGDQAAFVQVDLEHPLPLAVGEATGLFFDPARREEGRRLFNVERYHPPLSVVWNWLERSPALGVKVSPGVDLAELEAYPAELEFISLRGELREAALWFGPLKSAWRRATILPGPFTLSEEQEMAPNQPYLGPELPVTPPSQYLYEPDPAVIRSGLVRRLGAELNASQLDESIAYLTADESIETPFARSWQVEAWLPFQLKRLRAALREREVGHVVVKKRGSPIQPEALIHDLRLRGEANRVIFLTQWAGKPIAIICFPA